MSSCWPILFHPLVIRASNFGSSLVAPDPVLGVAEQGPDGRCDRRLSLLMALAPKSSFLQGNCVLGDLESPGPEDCCALLSLLCTVWLGRPSRRPPCTAVPSPASLGHISFLLEEYVADYSEREGRRMQAVEHLYGPRLPVPSAVLSPKPEHIVPVQQ